MSNDELNAPVVGPLGDSISHLELVQHMGNDAMIAKCAWVSYNNDLRHHSDNLVSKVLWYMLNHEHSSPFEHNGMTFRVTVPIFVLRQWHRHRIGWSYNEESRRYVDDDKSAIMFYDPLQWRGRHDTNKQGSKANFTHYQSASASAVLTNANEHALNCYKILLNQGVAPEMARFALPVNIYTHMYVTCNLQSLMRFVALRDHSHAQWEIRMYARAMWTEAHKLFPMACGMFDKIRHDRRVLNTEQLQELDTILGMVPVAEGANLDAAYAWLDQFVTADD